MKYKELDSFIAENALLKTITNDVSGVYAITIDNYIVYVGQSKNLYRRCAQHIYNIENAMCNKEKKYLLLLSAKLGGHKVDCELIAEWDESELNECEDWFIEHANPCLNILTPHGKQEIKNLKIEDVLNALKHKIKR